MGGFNNLYFKYVSKWVKIFGTPIVGDLTDFGNPFRLGLVEIILVRV